MATPIKETPILHGADARRFEKEVRENENRPVPQADYDRAQKTHAACIKAWGTDPRYQPF